MVLNLLHRWCFLAVTPLISICASVSGADIYRADLPDGSVLFASQKLSSSYSLHLTGERKPDKSATASTAPATLQRLIHHYARKHAIDTDLVSAVIDVESHYQSKALSPKGAFGLMQLMPATAHRYGVIDRNSAEQNIDAGVHYLKDLLTMHNGNEALALASYNAGEGAVAKNHRRIPPYRETMLYVAAVLARVNTARHSTPP